VDKIFRNPRTVALFILPIFIVYSLVIPIPLAASLLLSGFDWNLLGPMKFVGLKNFINLFTNDFILMQAMRNTFLYLACSILLQLPMAFLLANILGGSLRGRNAFRTIFYMPVTFSGVAVSLVWYFIYHPSIGPLNQLIRAIGFTGFHLAWLDTGSTALGAVIVSVAWQWTGYHMVLYLAGMASIPEEVIESARIDGANAPQLARHIIFPFLLPMLSVSTVLITTSSLKSFDSIYIMTDGGPNHATEVLASHMYVKSFAQLRYGYGSAIGVLLFVFCALATVAIRRLFKRLGEEDFAA
jgi:raffinose/stachyose/melibiose transport system permease protein